MTLAYSTAGLDPAQRFSYWNEVVCRHCIPASSQVMGDGPFFGQLDVFSMGPTNFSVMAASLHRWERQAHHTRAADSEDLWIGYVRSGQACVEQNGRQALVRDGDLVLYDAARPFAFTLASRAMYLLRLPRAQVLARSPAIEGLTGLRLEPGKPGVVALRSMLEQASALQVGPGPSKAVEHFGHTLLDLAATALEFQVCDQLPSSQQDLHARMLAYIERHLGDTTLSLGTIAQAHHVSSRTVTRAFAQQQQTAMGMVWHLRLEAAARALKTGRVRSMTEVALDHGFSDLSHFSRAFRKAFGCAPSRWSVH